jgi:fructose-bisphosphate aldolase class II
MPLIPMRVLLDHAAENNYGVGAFNVNNMEQIQAIMEAAAETNARSSCRPAAGPVRFARQLPAPPDAGRGRTLSRHPDRDAPGPRQQPGHLLQRHRERLHQRDDGRLAEEDGKTPATYEYNVKVTRKS